MKSIVIGSGFGGIAAALRLKAKNHNVTLIEKHPDLGGRARVFKKNGFTFDAGPTVITAPNPAFGFIPNSSYFLTNLSQVSSSNTSL